ncbi:MAG: hypothetical protein QOF97_2609, partial [Acidimicrobiaceae bacterium]
MEHASHTPLLTGLVIVPFLGALIVALLPRRRPEMVRMVAVLSSTLALALSIAVLVQFKTSNA